MKFAKRVDLNILTTPKKKKKKKKGGRQRGRGNYAEIVMLISLIVVISSVYTYIETLNCTPERHTIVFCQLHLNKAAGGRIIGTTLGGGINFLGGMLLYGEGIVSSY